jgi:uncharacterized protein (UPF0335 family)
MTDNVGAAKLASFIERLEKLDEEKRVIVEDMKDVLTEAKSAGYDPAILRAILKMRREDAQKRREREEILDVYLSALGQLADTPLGQWVRNHIN